MNRVFTAFSIWFSWSKTTFRWFPSPSGSIADCSNASPPCSTCWKTAWPRNRRAQRARRCICFDAKTAWSKTAIVIHILFAMNCFELFWIVLNCFELHCIALHCFAPSCLLFLWFTFVVMKDCVGCTVQLAVVSHIVVLHNCSDVTLSVCCGRFLVSSRFVSSLTSRASSSLLLYLYTPTNPLFVQTDSAECVVAPYNIPRTRLLARLQEAGLEGRNCWSIGLDRNADHFTCAMLPPEKFAPFVGEDGSYEMDLPLLPTAYEDQMRRSLKLLSA